jgi:hypothetical protein
MDFMQRGGRPNQPVATPNNQNTHTAGAPPNHVSNDRPGRRFKGKPFMRYASVGLLFAITLLLVAVIASFVFGSDTKGDEFSFVDKGKYQAVFLNGGQVYFGHIKDLDSNGIRIHDIYYLRVNQQVQPGQQANSNDVSLVKLGCELHGPEDRMVINREQVVFWENLKDDGQVAKAVKQYQEQNPGGQKCETSNATSTPQSGNSTPASTTTTPAATTPASTTKKP